MMRGLIIWGLWIAAASVLAAPQRILGAPDSSTVSSGVTEPMDTPADPVILEPIRPLYPDAAENVVHPRNCGSSEALMISSVAWLLFMLNVASKSGRARYES